MPQSTVKAALVETMAGLQNEGDAAKVVFRADTHLEEDMRRSAKVKVNGQEPETGCRNGKLTSNKAARASWWWARQRSSRAALRGIRREGWPIYTGRYVPAICEGQFDLGRF